MGSEYIPRRICVRLLRSGALMATGPVVEMNEDGMYVHTAAPHLAQGTYLEVQSGAGHRIGAMVEHWSVQGVRLVFASWSPQLFELMQRVAANAANQRPQPAARS